MNKKLFSKIISVLVLCNMIFSCFVVYAKDNYNENMSFIVEKISNNQIKLIINVKGFDKGILGFQGTFDFDSEELELVDVKINDENWRITALNKENGKFIAEINDEAFFDEEKFLYAKEAFMEITFNDLKKINNCKLIFKDIKLVDSMIESIELDDYTIQIRNFVWIEFGIGFLIITILMCFFIKKRKK